MKNRVEPFTMIDKHGKDKAFHLFDEMVHFEGAQSADHDLQYVKALREQYPDHIITATPQANANIAAYAAAGNAKYELDTESDSYASWKGYVKPLIRSEKGALGEYIQFAKYHLTWKDEKFIVYHVQIGFSAAQYILKERAKEENQLGPSKLSDDLVMAVGQWQADDYEVVWIFDGYWKQDRNLFKQVKSASWDKVILDEDMKKDLKQSATSFFASKKIYEDLGVPWKRGLLFHGPPGNGKTVSIKALMHTLLYERDDDPIPTLYVRNAPYPFQLGEIFRHARAMAKCMLVLEDIESIVNYQSRSYFFNELDGLDSNDGIFLVASTNYLERLDPGLTKRPSRFDRKYLFPLPNEHERLLYVQYWRKKVESNKELDFPEKLCAPMAHIMPGFSFAFMQECFVATLLILARKQEDGKDVSRLLAELSEDDDLEKYELWREFKKQANLLRKQIDEEELLRMKHQNSPHAAIEAMGSGPAQPVANGSNDAKSLVSRIATVGGQNDYPRGYLPIQYHKQPETNTFVWNWVGPRQ